MPHRRAKRPQGERAKPCGTMRKFMKEANANQSTDGGKTEWRVEGGVEQVSGGIIAGTLLRGARR